MSRIYVTYVEFTVEDEVDDSSEPSRLLEAKINELMELLDISEQQATSYFIRGTFTCG